VIVHNQNSTILYQKEQVVLKSIGWFLGAGFIWLFLFSIPIGHGKTLYQLGQHYIIKTSPIQWMGKKIATGYEATLEATDEHGLSVPFRELPEKLSRR
jgi:hypothetical protein